MPPSPNDYNLHTLGWKAFQDLCIAVAEECLKRPVQIFLPSHDAGRDGAFVGRWDGNGPHTGSSTIQCKSTSLPHSNLTLSMLSDELGKVSLLASKGLADDYIILTNHSVSGDSELKIREAAQAAGAKQCRIFGSEWIVAQIQKSPRLRMMVPRLYGLGDLSNILDERAYAQASMILSALGDDLKRLVVTDAHRKSVSAISNHNFVLLLGAPAAGKSTIGASLAVGAADIWNSLTIRATSPADIQKHLNPDERQFFWIDDAWGSTQYQRQSIEAWNQLFPLMQGAIKNGTKFLLTSRDYIWRAAQRDLKIQALPLLGQSRVIINVHDLSTQEKAQILYNHMKFGDQPKSYIKSLESFMPEIATSTDFLPETARRLGSKIFTGKLPSKKDKILKFFAEPAHFLSDTISNLAEDCRAAIALVYLNGGRASSPIEDGEELALTNKMFSTSSAHIRKALNALDGSLLLFAHDQDGSYWTYKHPTIGDAFSKLVAKEPELIELYLRGAKPNWIMQEVVCAGVELQGAPVVVTLNLYPILRDKILEQESYRLVSFLSYRADRKFTEMMLRARPDLLRRLESFIAPLADDMDAIFLAKLHTFGLLDEPFRLGFVEAARRAAIEDVDASFLQNQDLRSVFCEQEINDILDEVEDAVLNNVEDHIERVRHQWDDEYPPEDHFDTLERALQTFTKELSWRVDSRKIMSVARGQISSSIDRMKESYAPPATDPSSSVATKNPAESPLTQLFRDVAD